MSKKQNAKPDSKKTVTLFAVRPVKYNGERHYQKPFDADTDTANELVANGTCSLHTASTTDEPTREQILVDAIASLKPEQFDADGKPSLKALAKITGSVVTVEECDAAWATLQEKQNGK